MKRFFKIALSGLLACSMALGFGACRLSPYPQEPDKEKPPENEEPLKTVAVQPLDYEESTTTVYNPDQGFYIPVTVTVKADGVSYNENSMGSVKLNHLRMDISAFSSKAGGTDMALTQAALDGIESLVLYLREHDKNAIVRFCYAPKFGNAANCEPSLANMVNHIKQFCSVLNRFPSTVTALEVGMVGPWGEMHTSEIVKDPATINTLIDTFLKNTTALPVLVRTPKMIYNYLELPNHEDIYRLGIFNDGYLGSDDDLGTYADRETDVAFISGQTAHLPFGGEVTVPESTLHNIEVCLPEMGQIHLSYLNEQWNNIVVEKWKNTTVTENCEGAAPDWYGKSAYDYIQNHMGYRFVLKNSTFTYTENYDSLQIALTLENVGFGNLNKAKKVKILFVDENGKTAYAVNKADFNGENTLNYSLPLDLEKGSYNVYIRLYGDELKGEPRYALQFANSDLYDAALYANRVGSIEIK